MLLKYLKVCKGLKGLVKAVGCRNKVAPWQLAKMPKIARKATRRNLSPPPILEVKTQLESKKGLHEGLQVKGVCHLA